MRIVRSLAFLAACVLAATLAFDSLARPAGTEPPQEFELLIDGEKHAIELDRPQEITVGERKMSVRLRARPDRLFDNGAGARFRYPSNMAFEYERELDGTEMWTLDGSNCILMLARHPRGMSPELAVGAMVGGMIAQFPQGNPKRESISLTLGGKEVKGYGCTLRVGPAALKSHTVGFQIGKAVLTLTVQITLQDDGSDGAEAEGIRRLLARTWELVGAEKAAKK